MGTKLRPGEFDCYRNALPDEPMFVVLARDPSAPTLVRAWATGRAMAVQDGNKPLSDVALVEEALECADAMERWRHENEGVWRQAIPEGQRRVPAPWTKDREILVSFEGGQITVNGKFAGEQMDSDEASVWATYHNLMVTKDKS